METPSSLFSFGTGTGIGNNIPGASVPASDGGLFNQETAGTNNKIPSNWNFNLGGGIEGKKGEVREGCKQQ
jgi:hypothetical protein